MISADTWSVVLATVVGPIAAVAISMKMEERKSARARRHWIFSTLMGLRGVTLSQDHVRALNVVQVEFHRDENVISAWRTFLAHLETDSRQVGWNLKHRDLLNGLLTQMATSLGIETDAVDIARGGYAPQGWADRERDEGKVLMAKAKIADLVMRDEFDQWLKRMAEADYRVQFQRAVEAQNSRPAPLDSNGGMPE